CVATAIALAIATARARQAVTPIVIGVLVAGSAIATVAVLGATLSAAYAVDPVTGVPVGEAIPGNVRILAGPFNIIGAFALVVGALFSAYVFMPKKRVLGRRALPPGVAQIYGALAVVVNFFASLPRAAVALWREAIAGAMADLSAGRVSMPPRIAALVPERDGLLAAMPAYLPSASALTTKLVSLFPRNRDRPTHQAVIVVFDAEHGTPVAL